MNTAIILAGGKGKRMNSDVSKQFINIAGKPLLYYTLKKFKDNRNIDNIILVLPKDEIDYCKQMVLDKYSISVDCIVEGGKERQDSVYNALEKCVSSDIVLIHDGARPFVSDKIIDEGIQFANEYGAAAPGVMPKDTIKVRGSEGFSVETLNRSELVAIQTPQVFKKDIIFKCHADIKKKNINVTDDTMVVEKCGYNVFVYSGEYTNIKVTTPEDLVVAEYLAKN